MSAPEEAEVAQWAKAALGGQPADVLTACYRLAQFHAARIPPDAAAAVLAVVFAMLHAERCVPGVRADASLLLHFLAPCISDKPITPETAAAATRVEFERLAATVPTN